METVFQAVFILLFFGGIVAVSVWAQRPFVHTPATPGFRPESLGGQHVKLAKPRTPPICVDMRLSSFVQPFYVPKPGLRGLFQSYTEEEVYAQQEEEMAKLQQCYIDRKGTLHCWCGRCPRY